MISQRTITGLTVTLTGPDVHEHPSFVILADIDAVPGTPEVQIMAFVVPPAVTVPPVTVHEYVAPSTGVMLAVFPGDPAQTAGAFVVIVLQVGSALTVTTVVPAGEVQPLTVAVTL